MKRLNKTQFNILELIVNRPPSNLKKGYTFSWFENGNPMLSLQNLRMINQAFTLVERFPNVFKGYMVSMSLYRLELLDDEAARKILDTQLHYHY